MCFVNSRSGLLIFLGCLILGVAHIGAGDTADPPIDQTATTKNPVSSTSLLTPKTPTFKLEKTEYTIEHDGHVGDIATFKTVPEIQNIKYELIFDDDANKKDQLEKILEIDSKTGVLRTKELLKSGKEYKFSVQASLLENKSTAKVILKVTEDTKTPISFNFEKTEYQLQYHDDQIGVIEQFKTVPKIENIKYDLIFDDRNTENQLEQILEMESETGVLRTKKVLSAGSEHKFSVQASLLESKSKAKVVLKVTGVTCKQNDKPHFEKAFLKKHILEHKTDTIVSMNKVNEKCEYFLNNQKPIGEFFQLDKSTGKLEVNDKIDRESEVFRGQVQAHIRVELSIKCPSSRKKRSVQHENGMETYLRKFGNDGIVGLTDYKNPFEEIQGAFVRNILGYQADDSIPADGSSNQTTPSFSSKDEVSPDKDNKEDSTKKPPDSKPRHCFSPQGEKCDSLIGDSIVYNTQFMELLVLVDDVNDNPPEFTEKEYFFGYPDKSILSDILPDNLGSVHATDKDEGINAAIKYSVKGSDFIRVNPCNGILFPHYAFFKYEKFQFEIIATDKDGGADGLSKTTPVTVDILLGYQIMKMLIKRTLDQTNDELFDEIAKTLKANVKVLKNVTVPSMDEISSSIELNTKGYDIIEYYIIYAHTGQTFVDMNEAHETLQKNKDLHERILWIKVLASSPFQYVKTKSFVSTMVVLMLILCLASFVFYLAYIRTGKYYKCINYFKKTDSTTPLERDESSIGTSDYVVSFARMNHITPALNVVESDFTPVPLQAYDPANTQIINVDELTPAPPILVTSNSRRSSGSGGGDENSLSVSNDTRGRRKSTVSFNEIVEQYHTVHN